MSARLTGSVGQNGRNIRPDVSLVQSLLVSHGQHPGDVDGFCGPRTISAIRTFQAGFLPKPDGLVDVDGLTWKRLSDNMAPSPAAGISLTRLVPRPKSGTCNKGLVAVSNTFMTDLFGSPRDAYSEDCQPVTNAVLKRNIKTDSVGPFRVSGLAPAVDSLKQIFAQIAQLQPAICPKIGTAGMLCCRYQRGSTTAVSNHSWGTAIDLTINGVLDKRGDGFVQFGLTLIAPIFNQFGWYWGAMFPTEDAMHFEASQSLATDFKAKLT
jgi:peptidoglycan hydrolase-like protein with peptidoglycan-binding domain